MRLGRYGPYAQIGTEDDEDKPTFASLRPGQSMHTISLADALELFKLPRKLGQTTTDEEVSVGVGRFGAVRQARQRLRLAEEGRRSVHDRPARARVFLIEEKEEIARNRIIKAFDGSDIQVLNGRYGPYISDGKSTGASRRIASRRR